MGRTPERSEASTDHRLVRFALGDAFHSFMVRRAL